MKKKRTEYTLKILPESVKQGVATPVLQDLLLVRRPWPFNISSQIPEYLARATHIWHGSDDKIVSRPSLLASSLCQSRCPASQTAAELTSVGTPERRVLGIFGENRTPLFLPFGLPLD